MAATADAVNLVEGALAARERMTAQALIGIFGYPGDVAIGASA